MRGLKGGLETFRFLSRLRFLLDGFWGNKGCSSGYVKGLKGLLEFTRFLSKSLCLKGSTFMGLKGGLSDIVLLASWVGPFDGWLGQLTSSYWVLPSGKSNSKGDWLWWLQALLPRFAFEASSYPCAIGLSNVERKWIACRWSDLMQLATWGSAMSVCTF